MLFQFLNFTFFGRSLLNLNIQFYCSWETKLNCNRLTMKVFFLFSTNLCLVDSLQCEILFGDILTILRITPTYFRLTVFSQHVRRLSGTLDNILSDLKQSILINTIFQRAILYNAYTSYTCTWLQSFMELHSNPLLLRWFQTAVLAALSLFQFVIGPAYNKETRKLFYICPAVMLVYWSIYALFLY